MAAIRAGVACLIFLGLALTTGRRVPFRPGDLAHYAIIGTTTVAFPFFLLAWGQSKVSSSLAGVLFAGVPLVTVFLSWWLFAGTRPTALRASGALLGLLGVGIAFPNAISVGLDQMAGATAILGAAVSYAFGGLFLQRARAYDPITLMAGQFLLVTVTLLVVASILSDLPAARFATMQYGAALILGATGSALPLLCFFLLLQRTEPLIAASATFFIPFVAVGIGVVLLGEPARSSLLVGFAICAVGSALVLTPLKIRVN